MENISEEVKIYKDVTERLILALEKYPQGAPTTNSSTIHINAGGIGILIISILFAFIVGINLALGWVVFDNKRELSKQQDYLNAIYIQAPQLKPKENKK